MVLNSVCFVPLWAAVKPADLHGRRLRIVAAIKATRFPSDTPGYTECDIRRDDVTKTLDAPDLFWQELVPLPGEAGDALLVRALRELQMNEAQMYAHMRHDEILSIELGDKSATYLTTNELPLFGLASPVGNRYRRAFGIEVPRDPRLSPGNLIPPRDAAGMLRGGAQQGGPGNDAAEQAETFVDPVRH